MSASKYSYQEQDVCIIGYGCVLPDAPNPQKYWQNLIDAHSALGEVPTNRWNAAAHFHPHPEQPEKTYTKQACFVADNIINDIKLRLKENQQQSRLGLMTTDACAQALKGLDAREITSSKVDIILGCMAADESISHRALYRDCQNTLRLLAEQQPQGWQQTTKAIKEYLDTRLNAGLHADVSEQNTVVTSSVLHHIKKRFNLQGEATLIDAACASSLAAIDNAVARLQSGLCDIALSGGIEADLGASTFSLFCSVGALSKNHCYPFDKKAEGLVQGEGAVVFTLQRLGDALAQNKTIYGVIKGCGTASDGRNSSLFSPSVPGQLLAFQRAYSQAGNTAPDYIECHGTGTRIGDNTELTSLQRFFAKSEITIGSSKAYIGHTKGAAGAAGLLKCVLAMQHRQIPPSHYFEELPKPSQNIKVNREMQSLPGEDQLLRMAVSSFGFGNINYHLVLDEFSIKSSIRIASDATPAISTTPPDDMVLVAEIDVSNIDVSCTEITAYLAQEKLPIPPASLPQTDSQQLKAVIGTLKLLQKAGIHQRQLDKKTVSVIAASCLGLPKAWEFSARVGYDDLRHSLNHCSLQSQALVTKCQQQLTPITEDIGPGILNNIIAAKVSNTFDFNGSNYNIDADYMSLALALDAARQELNKHSSVVFILASKDNIDTDNNGLSIKREGLVCLMLTKKSTALEKAYPIKSIIKKNRYSD